MVAGDELPISDADVAKLMAIAFAKIPRSLPSPELWGRARSTHR